MMDVRVLQEIKSSLNSLMHAPESARGEIFAGLEVLAGELSESSRNWGTEIERKIGHLLWFCRWLCGFQPRNVLADAVHLGWPIVLIEGLISSAIAEAEAGLEGGE